jgi:hypothetical protein
MIVSSLMKLLFSKTSTMLGPIKGKIVSGTETSKNLIVSVPIITHLENCVQAQNCSLRGELEARHSGSVL